MENKNIKNLLFDFGGVLIDLDMQRCVDNFRRLDWNGIEAELGTSLKAGFLQQLELGLITADEFRNRIRKALGRQISDAEIDACWNSFLVGVPQSKLDMLLSLRHEYKVCLLSNTNVIHWQWSLENAFGKGGHSIGDYFDAVFLSFELHLAKPDKRIFRYAIDHAGIEPAETLFIDDLQQNCDAAASMGFSTYTAKAYEDLRHIFSK